METGIRHTHLLSVALFLFIYFVKNYLLLMDKEEGLAKFTKIVKVPEMIISTAFLLTGIYMLTQVPEIKSLLIIKIILVLASIPLAIIGFKKKKKALALVSLVLLIAAYGLAEMSKKQKSSAMEGMSATTVDGQEIYSKSCAQCHGADGKQGALGASDLSISSMDIAGRIELIANGKNAMTPFAGTLTEEQIKAVAEYSMSLKK